MAKKDGKQKFIRWVLRDLNFEVKDIKGTENHVAKNLSTLENEYMCTQGEKAKIKDVMRMYWPLRMI